VPRNHAFRSVRSNSRRAASFSSPPVALAAVCRTSLGEIAFSFMAIRRFVLLWIQSVAHLALFVCRRRAPNVVTERSIRLPRGVANMAIRFMRPRGAIPEARQMALAALPPVRNHGCETPIRRTRQVPARKAAFSAYHWAPRGVSPPPPWKDLAAGVGSSLFGCQRAIILGALRTHAG
jgi:hypothetical protein